MVFFLAVLPGCEKTRSTPFLVANHVSYLDASWTFILPSLKLTFSHLKMDGWNTSFLLGWPIFTAMLVSGSVGVGCFRKNTLVDASAERVVVVGTV